MKATASRLTAHGSPLVTEQVELGDPGPDEVLVDLRWGGVNPVDRYAAMGLAAAEGPVPRTMGTEASGVADGTNVLIHGSGVGSSRDGVWATAAVVPRSSLIEVPDGVSSEKAAACGIAGATAWRVVEVVGVTASDRVLVLGASGGVGSMIVSLVHSIGATVWGQTEKASNSDWILERGADRVVVSGSEGLAEKAADLEPTVAIDPLGAGFTAEAIKLLATHGRLAIFGTSAGQTGEVPLQQIYRKGITIFGYGGLVASSEDLRVAKREALKAVAGGRLDVEIGATYGLEDVNTAFQRLVDRDVLGKILLDLGN